MSLEQALKRPDNYNQLSPQEQWDIDKQLGILDWMPTKAEEKEYLKIMKGKKMPSGELLKIITTIAKKYRTKCNQSLKINKHMNDLDNVDVSQDVIDAILVDFINYIGMEHGVDYAIYARDLFEERPVGTEWQATKGGFNDI